MSGSGPHRWHDNIDDATSKLEELRFAESASTYDYFATTREGDLPHCDGDGGRALGDFLLAAGTARIVVGRNDLQIQVGHGSPCVITVVTAPLKMPVSVWLW